MPRLIALFFVLSYSFAVFADVRPAGVFTGHAVLQQGEPVRIWGTATPGEKITVQFAGQTQSSVADKDGNSIPAKAELKGGKITVSAAGINDPEYVRYGWEKWFVPTLFNAEGLPASPFRTDDFPPATKDRYYLDRKEAL